MACPLRKFGPSPTPLRPLCGLGAKAARCRASRLVQPKIRPDSPYDGPELHPAKARFFSFTLERTSASSGHKNCTSHACSHTAASKRRAADATPGGRPLFLAALERPPLASAGAARHSKAGVCSDKPAGDDLSSEKTYSVRAPSDSFYFAKSEIVESLLRRGARVLSLHFAPETQQKMVARGDFISIVLSHNE